MILLCTVYPGVADGDQKCMTLKDPQGLTVSIETCQARLQILQADMPSMRAAAYYLKTKLQYGGPIKFSSGCQSTGRYA